MLDLAQEVIDGFGLVTARLKIVEECPSTSPDLFNLSLVANSLRYGDKTNNNEHKGQYF